MKNITQTILIALLLVTCIVTLLNSAKSQNPSAESAQFKKLPVGTILPWYPYEKNPKPPKGWIIPDGRVIQNGPLKGRKAPNLTDDRFLMGVYGKRVGKPGGKNSIPDKTLNHGWNSIKHGEIGYGSRTGNATYKGKIKSHGSHNHGGENRPKYLGVLFIMKIQ